MDHTSKKECGIFGFKRKRVYKNRVSIMHFSGRGFSLNFTSVFLIKYNKNNTISKLYIVIVGYDEGNLYFSMIYYKKLAQIIFYYLWLVIKNKPSGAWRDFFMSDEKLKHFWGYIRNRKASNTKALHGFSSY